MALCLAANAHPLDLASCMEPVAFIEDWLSCLFAGEGELLRLTESVLGNCTFFMRGCKTLS